ncbi:hypothetical protein NDU88_006349 [Pleurodeles waltl]|uniref:Uncharacterized protein n=1 Tax=Pleurodeles waltl TaxID=8319 RepID=A0AAV7SPL1_PLEWA|nr:hypothetical protein NDU88_006349 [Pleurodeles waltl]
MCQGPRQVATGSGSLRRPRGSPSWSVPEPGSQLHYRPCGLPHTAHLTWEPGGPPPQGALPSRLLRRPGGSGGDQVVKAARTPQLRQLAPPGSRAAQPGTPGAPFAARGSAVPSIHQGPRSRAQRRLPPGHRCTPGPGQLRQGAGSSESALPGGSGSDGHFLTPAASREWGSASPPLTTSGPQRDGEIAGMVGTAPLGR